MLEEMFGKNKLNERLVPQLRSLITNEKYGDLSDILIEILLRRQQEFEIDDTRILSEAENMIKYLPLIQVVPKKELDDPSWDAQSGTDGIYISYEEMRKHSKSGNFEELYEVLVHEVYHSIAMKEDTSGICINEDFRGLNEALNEAAANRASLNIRYQHGYRLTTSYCELTFISNALAAAIGVSEKELLKAAISVDGYTSLKKLILQKGMSEESVDDFLNSVSQQIKVIHDGRGSRFSVSALGELSNTLFNYLSQSMNNDKREFTSVVAGEYSSRYTQLYAIFEDRKKYYLGNRRFEQLENAKKLVDTQKFEKFKDIPGFDSYYDQIIEQDFNESHNWDNSAVDELMRTWSESECTKYRAKHSLPKFLSSIIDCSKRRLRTGQIIDIVEETKRGEPEEIANLENSENERDE